MSVIVKKPWTKQPQTPVGIDKSNPIARKLTHLYGQFQGRNAPDAAGFAHGGAFGANANIAGSIQGTVLVASANSNAAGAVPIGNAAGSANPTNRFSLFVRAYIKATGSASQLWGVLGDDGVHLYVNSGTGSRGTACNKYGTANIATSGSSPITADGWYNIGVSYDGTNGRFYYDGRLVNTTAITTTFSHAQQHYLQAMGLNSGEMISMAAVFGGAVLSAEEFASLTQNPWQLYAKQKRILFTPAAGGPVTHAATGALTAQSATIAGTAAHIAIHPSTGALTAQSATIAGSAARSRIRDSVGALTAQSATIAGTAAHIAKHAATGALVAGAATIAGTADHPTAGTHDSTGALVAGVATVAGTAAHIAKHAATGSLVADSAIVAGTAAHIAVHDAVGALVAQSAGTAATAANGVAVLIAEVSAGGFRDYGENKRIHASKKLLEDAEELIQEVKVASPEQAEELFDEAADITQQLKREVARLEVKARQFQAENKRSDLIRVQLIQERLEAQIEEIDTVFAMFMMLAQMDD